MAKKENPSESPAAVEPFVEEAASPYPTFAERQAGPIGDRGLPVSDMPSTWPKEVHGELAVLPVTEPAVEPDDTIAFGEPGPEPLKTAEAWHAELETEGWEFAAAKAHHQWPEGREMTADQYRAAVATASGVVSR